MGSERLRRILVTGLVDGQVAGSAAVHLGNGGEIYIIPDVFDYDLVDCKRRSEEIHNREIAKDVCHLIGEGHFLRVNYCQFALQDSNVTQQGRQLPFAIFNIRP